jgi:TctA family transporter
LWLIGNPRSGVAVALDQLISVDAQAIGLIIFSLITAAAIAAPMTLWLARIMLSKLQKIDYVRLSQGIFIFLVAAVGVATGPLGLLLAAACSGLGLLVNILEVKRGILMGVLILPTMFFFLGM